MARRCLSGPLVNHLVVGVVVANTARQIAEARTECIRQLLGLRGLGQAVQPLVEDALVGAAHTDPLLQVALAGSAMRGVTLDG